MGTGSSKQNTTKESKQLEQTLPGSSVPPKGLPRQKHSGKLDSNVSNGSADFKSKINRPKEQHVKLGHSEALANGQVTDAKSAHIAAKATQNFELTREETTLRKKSAYVRRNDTKNLYRKMEMGMEDEEDVDNILGLDRMKTRIQLKREKTKLRKPDRKATNSMLKFQQAALKIKSSGLKVDKPRTIQDELIMGNLSQKCPSTVKVVRIFTSSTFTDTKHERNMLMENAYPRIKAYCQDLGYDFQVVDMRWGIRDEATDDQLGTEICLRELNMCKKLSTGPNFVSMMSHKYGYADFPRRINATEYETILKHVDSKEVEALFKKWYNKDTNADPPEYVVYPISHHIPDFLSNVKEKKDVAKKQWYKESEIIQATLEQTAQKVFDVDTARKYIRSITETEVFEGLLSSSDPPKQCLWMKRTIEGLDKVENSFLLSRFTECTFNNSEEKVEKVKEMLETLKAQMSMKLQGNLMEFKVKWDPEKGLDPSIKEHKDYIEKMNDAFVERMCSMIHSAVQEKNAAGDPLVEEVIQHTQFCQEKCRQFHGRDDVLKHIKFYMKGMSTEPLVVHGASGSGKTSIVAMAAMSCGDWFGNKAVVILRFIGTTPDSSSIIGLLTSIVTQIRRAYNLDLAVSKDLQTLIDEFHLSLFLASADRPLVIILDSLDMLDTAHNARQLLWLPSKLRANVKLVVSTLPDSQFEAFPVLQKTVHTAENFVKIPSLTDSDAGEIIDKWLKMKHRKLTPEQKKIVTTMCTKCPLPLYLKLTFDKASSWTSFVSSNSTALEPTVRQSIDGLFERLERMHGKVFVSRALGYLTLARNGLTETELEDILSCDDDVLNDVYMYWTPPIRRLPPLLLVRLRADLDQYLVDRGADGAQVMNWYHRQFIEAAQNRYCADTALNKNLHSALADFFAGIWANGQTKPFTTGKGENGSADRHVAAQPNKFGNSYNLRKLNNLPYHRCSAMQPDVLKSESLCNLEFMLDKLKATSLWALMDDFSMAKKQFPNDELLTGIEDVLRLSQVGLLYDPCQLVPQLLGRLPNNKVTAQFLKACESFLIPSLLPDKRILTEPGGQLLHSMAGHKGDILSLDLTADSTTAVTCSDDGSVRLWNIITGQQILNMDGLGKVSRAMFCCHDNCILVDLNKKLTVRAKATGEKVFDMSAITDDSPSCLCGENKTLLAVFKEHSASVYDLKDGVQQFSIQLSENVEFKFPGFAVGSKNFAVATTSDQVYLTVLDLKKRELSSLFRGFEPFQDQDVGEEIQYEIDEIAITKDEKYVIYSNIYTNDIVFLDFRAKKKPDIVKGNPNDYIRSLKCSSDGKAIFYVKGQFVCFRDIKTSNTVEELEHTVDVISACTNDMKTIVTTAEDSNVRVWDRTRKVQKMSQAPGSNAYRIRLIRTLKNSRYIVGFGFKSRENDSQILFVYDLFKHSVVREKSLDCSILHMEVLNDTELLVVPDVIQKLKVISINTLQVTREFQGYLPNIKWTFDVVTVTNEIACLSVGRHNVKLYNIQTGKTSAVLETKHHEKLDGFCTSANGQMLATWCEDTGNVFLFDLAQRKLLYKIRSKQTAMFDEDQLKLTPDNKRLLFKVEGVPQKSRKDEDEVYVEVWDIQKGSKVCDLVDIEYHNRYHSEKEKSGISSSLDTFEILDDTTVLAAHDDYILRVFNMITGELLRRLHGHSTCVEILYTPESPFIVTFGSWTEEMSLRVWDKTDYSCITSYTMDRMVTNLDFSSDRKFIFATLGKPVEIVTWKFNHFKQDVDVKIANYPETLAGQDLKGFLNLVPEEDELIVDCNDPDKDVAEESADDDDDFV